MAVYPILPAIPTLLSAKLVSIMRQKQKTSFTQEENT